MPSLSKKKSAPSGRTATVSDVMVAYLVFLKGYLVSIIAVDQILNGGGILSERWKLSMLFEILKQMKKSRLRILAFLVCLGHNDKISYPEAGDLIAIVSVVDLLDRRENQATKDDS